MLIIITTIVKYTLLYTVDTVEYELLLYKTKRSTVF